MCKTGFSMLIAIALLLSAGSITCAQIIVEGAGAIWEKTIEPIIDPPPPPLPRIITEYASTIFAEEIVFPTEIVDETDGLPKRIVAEYSSTIKKLKTASFPADPEVNSIYFDACISELCTSSITIDAVDPLGGVLTYEWEAINGGEVGGTGSSVVFDPPNAGPHACPYQVKVTVLSNKSGLYISRTIDIYVKLAGDVDGNGVVNVLDKVQVRNHFGESGSPGWIDADVDCNGVVNVIDKVKVRNQFGQSGCACP